MCLATGCCPTCSRVAAGETYERALQEAREIGLAEPDAGSDVDGHDSVSKLMVLAALVFGIQLTIADGLSDLEPKPGDRIREVMTLDPAAGIFGVEARQVAPDDPLAGIDGA